jgi:7-carboxy-7-deazaguanine synthase
MYFLVSEIFHSIQGETSHSGLPYTFVRLTGCNLRCSYCDTSYAFSGGTKTSLPDIVAQIESIGCKRVLLTGGEPLIQKNILELIRKIHSCGFEVSIETHGQAPIAEASKYARIVMDIKTPSSGEQSDAYKENLTWLKPGDEIKFVISTREDYVWSREIVQSKSLAYPCGILFSPATQAEATPGKYQPLEPQTLAQWILEDKLEVRLQVQLHKVLWGYSKRGV